MQNRDNAFGPLLLAAAAAIAIAIFATRGTDHSRSADQRPIAGPASATAPAVPPATTAPVAAKPTWAASAPGRVEPKGGEVKISPLAGGRIVDVMVSVNQKVNAGDLLLRMEDSEIETRLAAADAETSVRKRDRDQETVNGPARDRRTAEDAAFTAERLFSLNRAELDRWLVAKRQGLATDADVTKVRDTVAKAREAVDTTRAALRRILAETQIAQTRLESALAAARAELAAADAAAERLRIRAPSDGTVLQLAATIGESVAPSPENVLVVLGDVSALRVKAEIEERDIGKLRVGQQAIVRSDAFPGREFDAKVTAFAQALGPSKLGQKGPRKLSDVDVLEATLELAGQPPLLPGMRVDVLFRPDGTANAAPAKVN
jgi:HlyD family secretion protein